MLGSTIGQLQVDGTHPEWLTRETRCQQLVNRAVTRDCKTMKTHLCTAWIDYMKAPNSLQHTWILLLELLDMSRT